MVEDAAPKGGAAEGSDAPPPSGASLPAVSNLARDIRGPLAVVIANLDFAVQQVLPGDGSDASDASNLSEASELRDALSDARDAAERISAVVTHALASWPPAPGRTAIAGEVRTARTLRVLVIDDEPSIGSALRRCLREHEVVVTTSGQEALARLSAGEEFDVILCDLMMPGMPGFDVHAELVRIAPSQAERMIFLTGGATTTRGREFLANVTNTVLEKPFNVKKLRELIRDRT
jgi:CheY-like chemotaxis protein